MCGISGFIGRSDSAENVNILTNMSASIAHRGPDDHGVDIIQDQKLQTVALAQQRLAVIDLSPSGHQPMASNDENIRITFNGEIYNYKKLKEEFASKYQFKGASDTEVIIAGYKLFGEKIFERLEGMFALALYDKNKNKVVLARDRMGEKPLYYSLIDGVLVFGSELKVFHQYPNFKKKISQEALEIYFFAEHIPAPHTIFEGVYKVLPGHILHFDGKAITTKAYWEPSFEEQNISYQKAKQNLDTLLDESIKDRMVADVPVGVLLSGGVDSSTVAWYAKKYAKQHTLKTFSIGFTEKSFDESSYARAVAAHLGTDHYEKIITSDDMLKLVFDLPDISDEPMADSSIIPTAILSQWTREHVTVALGGDGGDELFYGYDTFQAKKWASLVSWIPNTVIRFLFSVVSYIPVSHRNMSFDFKLKKFLSGLFEKNVVVRNEIWLSAFGEEEQRKLFKESSSKKGIGNYLSSITHATKNIADTTTALGRAYELSYMADHVLVKVDRASMRYALETRAPLLGESIVSCAHRLPAHYKLRGFTGKAILKDLMRERLPEGIIDRPKKGFGIPLAAWLSGPLLPMLQEFSSKEFLDKQGLFNFSYVDELIKEHVAKKVDHRKKLWTFLVFQMWWKKWMS